MPIVCPCANPPGGTITCNDNQLAICGTRDGQIVAGCFDPPATISDAVTPLDRIIVTANWTLSLVTGKVRDDHQELSAEDRAIFNAGVYKNEKGEEIRFTVPGHGSSSSV